MQTSRTTIRVLHFVGDKSIHCPCCVLPFPPPFLPPKWNFLSSDPLHLFPCQDLNPRPQGLPCPTSYPRAALAAADAGDRATRGKKLPSSADHRCKAHEEPLAAITGWCSGAAVPMRCSSAGQVVLVFSALCSHSLANYFHSTSGHVDFSICPVP